MTTTTLVGTPDPDNHSNHQHTPVEHGESEGVRMTSTHDIPPPAPGAAQPYEPAQGRIIDFPAPAGRDPMPPVDDGDDADDEDGAGRVLVDPPARDPGRELLPWQRREVVRRPVIAPWLTRTEDVRAAGRWAAGWAWHATGFHTVRAPLYAAKLAARAPRGAGVALASAARWVNDAESSTLRAEAVRAGDADRYLKLAEARAARVRVRRRLAFAGLLAGAAGLLVLHAFAPAWLVLTLALAAVLVLGWVGTPADRPVTGRSVVRTQVQRLTSDIVVRALASLGIAEINKAMGKGGGGITFPAPITRDGPGWRADVDLPYGVTVSDIAERRDRLASGLRRPLGCVWPEPASEAHAGRLVLWVGDQDMAAAKPAPWPLARGGAADLFRPVPFGVDQRGRRVALSLIFESMLIGSKPRMGKTFAMRVVLLAAALDPGAQLRIFELKGTGDLSMVENCCHHYGSGADPTTLEACMESLRDLYAQLDTRAAAIRKLPREICPENKVTPEISARRGLGLFLIVAGIDECQELFSHPDYKDEAARLAEAIIKRGPALGIILVLATQRPDAKSLPTGVSANVGIRFCLRVMGQTENDMVLGTSSYQNGLRATTFGPRDKGIGYLVGAGDDPQIVRTAYIDGPAAEVIGARARALREAAGTITGHAAGEDTEQHERPARSVLGDIAEVFGPDEDRLWSEVIAARLAEQWPTAYRSTTPASLAASLKPYGLAPAQVWGTDPDTGEGRNRRGYLRDAVTTAWLATRKDRGPNTPGGDSA
ncbi:cell division protein FtsK [Pseudonocardia sp. DSM 110487]|uniref:cell division protein FtsK n=1 Tax=Pseudonocardia sp. DSM 110487 TaxID=2865833 RepID=UPI001C6A18D7|nr:cell division protein FtsK [Pseudonocardia sp. DSM 110487]QYN35188.1 cell division protein FtsK [Pseudonocardia sp. DSM 110487]